MIFLYAPVSKADEIDYLQILTNALKEIIRVNISVRIFLADTNVVVNWVMFYS